MNRKDLEEQFATKVWTSSAGYELTFERGSYLSGESSMGFSYIPQSGSGYVKVQKEFAAPLDWSDFRGLSVFIYGDASGNEISVKFKNGNGDIWRSPWVKVDWKGWKKIDFGFSEFRLDLFDADSGPGNRSMMLGEVRAFALAERGPRNSKLMFDEIRLVSDKDIRKIRLAGENEPPAGSFLWGIQTPRGKGVKYAVPKDWSEASGLSFRVKGDRSGREIAVMVADSDNEYYRTPWISLVWDGWKTFYYDFDVFVRETRTPAQGQDLVFGQKGVKAVSLIAKGGKEPFVTVGEFALATARKSPAHDSVRGLKGFSSKGKAYLYWESSDNPFQTGFNVYRGGSRIGSTDGLFFVDTAPGAGAADYGVTAVYSDGNEGGMSQARIGLSAGGKTPRKDIVTVNGNWLFVEGVKFFVKGAVYSPYKAGQDPGFDTPSAKSVENDAVKLKQSGFNTLMASVPLSDRELIIAAKNGLMVIQDLGGDVKDITARSRRHDNILYYNISGEESLSSAEDKAREARLMDPDREVCVTYGENRYYPRLPVFGIAGMTYAGSADYVKWYKDSAAAGKPLVVTCVSAGKGAGALEGIITAGAAGICTADRSAAVCRIFDDFWPYYAKAARNDPYDESAELGIKTDRESYAAGQKPRLSFTLKRQKRYSVADAALEYYAHDIKNDITTKYAAKTDRWGRCRGSFTLPYNTDDTVFSVFATATMKDGKRVSALKHFDVAEDSSLKERFRAEVKIYARAPYEIRRVTREIKVDGFADDAWDAAADIKMDSSRSGKPVLKSGDCGGDRDLSGTVKLMWDDESLYLLADIKDDLPLVNSRSGQNIRNGDALEVFLSTDPDNLPKEGYSSRDFQVAIGANGKAWIYGQADTGTRNASPAGYETASRKTDTGYMLEARIPLDNFGYAGFSEGKEIGLDIALDDADEAGSRECQLIWNGAEDNDRNSRYFGRAVLKGAR